MPAILRKASSRVILLLGAFSLVQLACSAIDSAQPTSAAPTSPAQEANPTSAVSPMLTPEPTQPAAGTPQMPGLPDRPLSQAGPWFVFMDYTVAHELWALNPDGSGATMLWSLVDEQASESYALWPAPSGGRVALLQYSQSLRTAPVLRVLELPTGKELAVVNLLPRQTNYDSLEGEARSAADQVWAAVGVWNRPAWSPDGRWLAFNAAIDGPSADVYVYDTSTNTIERLTDGPDQSVDLAWSPDSAYIVHGVADSLYYGYSGLGYGMISAWAAPPDPDKPVLRLYDHVFHGYEYILGWLGDSRYLGDSLDGDSLGNCGYSGLRTVDIKNGPGPSLLAGSYSLRAFDAGTGLMVLVLSPSLAEFDCPTSLDPGVYLFDINSRKASRVPDVDPEPIMSVTWSRASRGVLPGRRRRAADDRPGRQRGPLPVDRGPVRHRPRGIARRGPVGARQFLQRDDGGRHAFRRSHPDRGRSARGCLLEFSTARGCSTSAGASTSPLPRRPISTPSSSFRRGFSARARRRW